MERGSRRGLIDVKGGPNNLKNKKKFYVSISEGTMAIYKDEASYLQGGEGGLVVPHFPLNSAETKAVDKDKKIALSLTSKTNAWKDYKLYFENEQTRQQWATTIKEASTYVATAIFGLDLETAALRSKSSIPVVVTKCIEYLKPYTEVEGLFRISGAANEVDSLRQAFDSGQDVNLQALKPDCHAVSNALKLYFRELPNPLLPFEMYNKFISAAKEGSATQLQKLAQLISELPKSNQDTLRYLLQFLKQVSEKSAVNMMTPLNLATCFGPTILKSREESLMTAGNNDLINPLTEKMIQNWTTLFPAQQQAPQSPSVPPTRPVPTLPMSPMSSPGVDRSARKSAAPGAYQPMNPMAMSSGELSTKLAQMKQSKPPSNNPQPEIPSTINKTAAQLKGTVPTRSLDDITSKKELPKPGVAVNLRPTKSTSLTPSKEGEPKDFSIRELPKLRKPTDLPPLTIPKQPQAATANLKSQSLETLPSNSSSTSNWQELTSPDGRKYYYDTKTKVTTWEKPPGFNGGSTSALSPTSVPPPVIQEPAIAPQQTADSSGIKKSKSMEGIKDAGSEISPSIQMKYPTLESKLKALEDVQKRNADLLKRIQNHLTVFSE